MDDNGTAMGRMSASVLAMTLVITCAFLLFSWFISSAKKTRDTDTQRRQQQKDSISMLYESPSSDLCKILYHNNLG